jgi:hypothetical protein
MNGTRNRRARGRTPALLVALTLAVSGLVVDGLGPRGSAQEITLVADEGREGRAPTDVELTPSVEAAFPEESYDPGDTAQLVVSNRAHGLSLQLFRVGPEQTPTVGNVTMRGVAVTRRMSIGASNGRLTLPVSIGDWSSGLYFARLEAADGRVGFAPFVVRPGRLGEHRVAIVLPTLTWQAYNLRDDDGDGKGDSWYAQWSHRTVRLGRPFLNRGVPSGFRRYDLPFLRWLARTGREADVLAQADLEAASSRELDDAYDLMVFPGHHEYVTTREYDAIEGYRDLGGNLAFLSANNFFWRVARHGGSIEKTRQWRDLGRPEAALIGVQYLANQGRKPARAAWILRETNAVAWLFASTGLRAGSRFGSDFGVEIDHTTPASPKGIEVVAEIPDLLGPGRTAQMTYYETRSGAKVFAAGAFTLAGRVWDPVVARVAANLWRELSDPDPVTASRG